MLRAVRLLALFVCATVLGAFQVVVLAVTRRASPAATVLPRLFHRCTCAVLGLRVQVHGKASTAAPTVWISNHISYLDVAVLGAHLPGVFVAKSEVREWPVFGSLARLQRTVFIGRRATDAKRAMHGMASALAAGANLILFPEGTTSDGTAVLPFHSSVFALLVGPAGMPCALQPVTLHVVSNALGQNGLAPYAYHSDDVLVPHFGRFLRRRRTDVELTLHEPVSLPATGGRKEVARHLRDVVAFALPTAPAP